MSFLREPNAEPISGYRLIEPLGSGGFGEAWKCEAPGGIHKAIKFVYGNLNSLDIDGARAEQELKALNRVKEVRHPFILSMDRIEVVEGELVIVMELADRNLHEVYQDCVATGLVGIPRDTLLRYVRDAAEALDHMNEKHNLQHLDVKPRNLFLVSDRVKVADFGLVKHLERSGLSSVQGGVTPLYAPPETFGGTISGASDQYSLAIVYMEMLTGQRPFNGKTVRALAQQHLHEEPDLRALPEAERPVLGRALAKDPKKRFPSCLAFVRALYNCRSPASDRVLAESGIGPGSDNRPKTIADTMEDIFLDQLPDDGGGVPAVAVSGTIKAPRAAVGEGGELVSQLGMTMALPETGSLRPTLVIGLGSFGGDAIRHLRCRLTDRLGDPERAPMFRLLYLDTDQEALRMAVRGPAETALRSGEVHHLPLQPLAHYRKRQLEQLFEWLPREKLYSLPRSLTTQGSRALGRLAFHDNYLRLMTRVRREIQLATNPDTMYQTVSQTGLALRDGVPRVYIVGSATGGSSGFLLDLGYALRRLLHQMQHPDATLAVMLFGGSPDDPASPRSEQANVYATLTELNHFSDPTIRFSSQYGSDGPRLVEEGKAFDAVYLLPMRHRTPEARQQLMAQLSSYLCDELTTPLGLRLERFRQTAPQDTLALRTIGTYGVWFPRGLLLRQASKQTCQRLLEKWQQEGGTHSETEIQAAHDRLTTDPDLAGESLAGSLGEKVARILGSSPADALTTLLASLEEQVQQYFAQDDPESWTRQALQRVQEWLGTGIRSSSPQGWQSVTGTSQRKSRLTRGLEEAAGELAAEWEERVCASAFSLMELPGRRLAMAEAALARMIEFCDQTASKQQERIDQMALRTDKSRRNLEAALASCITGSGGFSWFRGGIRRSLRVFMDQLAAFARQCLAEDLAGAIHGFYLDLRGRLRDRIRDLALCRQRLRHLQEELDRDDSLGGYGGHLLDNEMALSPSATPMSAPVWETMQGEGVCRVVLPEGAGNLEDAAWRLVEGLTREQWTQLDQTLQDHVLGLLGGLFRACMTISDLKRSFAPPLLTQATHYLESQMPLMDVAQVEFSLGSGQENSLNERVRDYYSNAAPMGPQPAREEPVASRSSAEIRLGEDEAVIVGRPPWDRGLPRPASLDQIELSREAAFLLMPSSEAGKLYGEQAEKVLPQIQIVPAPNQADLLFCREQENLTPQERERLFRSCKEAYEAMYTTPQHSPHCRFDVPEWLPLE